MDFAKELEKLMAGEERQTPSPAAVTEEQVQEAHQTLETLGWIVRSEGWKEIKALLEAQVTSRQMKLLQPLASRDAVLEQEYTKGELAGLLVPVQLVEGLVATSQQIIEIQEKIDAAGN